MMIFLETEKIYSTIKPFWAEKRYFTVIIFCNTFFYGLKIICNLAIFSTRVSNTRLHIVRFTPFIRSDLSDNTTFFRDFEFNFGWSLNMGAFMRSKVF